MSFDLVARALAARAAAQLAAAALLISALTARIEALEGVPPSPRFDFSEPRNFFFGIVTGAL